MKSQTISERLREAIKRSAVSRYELAKQVAVAESVLSRFVAGKQGISLTTADRLAEILGLQLADGVSRLQQPKPAKKSIPVPRERTPKKRSKMSNEERFDPEEMRHLANILTFNAYDCQDSSRRGVWETEFGVVCLYDSHPYNDLKRGSSARREAEHGSLVERLKAEGGEVVAQASYPRGGKRKGYTVTWLFKGVSAKVVARTYEKVLSEANGAVDVAPRPMVFRDRPRHKTKVIATI